MNDVDLQNAPTIKTKGKDENGVWRAEHDVVPVKAGEWVIFDFESREGRLWFPIKGQATIEAKTTGAPPIDLAETPLEVTSGKVNVRLHPELVKDTIVPYIFYLYEPNGAGDMLIASSPPYIKIKDPTGGTRDLRDDPA